MQRRIREETVKNQEGRLGEVRVHARVPRLKSCRRWVTQKSAEKGSLYNLRKCEMSGWIVSKKGCSSTWRSWSQKEKRKVGEGSGDSGGSTSDS